MNRFKRIGMWTWMLSKRYLKNVIILLTIIAIPLTVLLLGFATGKDEAAIRVALYAEGNDLLSMDTVKHLTGGEASVIRFYRVNSEEAAYQEVGSGEAVCAYIFPENFDEMVEKYVSGERGQLTYDGHLIKCIQAEKTNYSKITEEMVFASFYKKFAQEVLYDFMKEKMKDFSDEDWEIIRDYYDEYNIDAEFFRFEYIDGSENTLISEQNTSFLLLPIRGLILTLILLAGMTGGVVAYRDKERGMFQSITVNRRGILNYLYILVPTSIVAMAGLVGIWFANVWTGFTRELTCMVLYVFLVTGMCNLIRKICGSEVRFASTIPLYLMTNLIFSPVFLDIATLLPQINYIRPLLPVNYGLTALYDSEVRIEMVAVSIITILAVNIKAEFLRLER